MCLKIVKLFNTAVHYLTLQDDIFMSYHQVITGRSHYHYFHGFAPLLVIAALLLYVHRYTGLLNVRNTVLSQKSCLGFRVVSFLVQVLVCYAALVFCFLAAIGLQEIVYRIARHCYVQMLSRVYSRDVRPADLLGPMETCLLSYASLGLVLLFDASNGPRLYSMVPWLLAHIIGAVHERAKREMNALRNYIAGSVEFERETVYRDVSGVPATEADKEVGEHYVTHESAGDAPPPLARWKYADADADADATTEEEEDSVLSDINGLKDKQRQRNVCS